MHYYCFACCALVLIGLPLSLAIEPVEGPIQWHLVDNYQFDYASNEQFHSDPNWMIDDEPENLCLGENIFQYSCHRMKNVAVSGTGQLEIRADINRQQRNSRFLFNSGKLTSAKSWLYGKFVMRAMLPEGKLLRAVFVLKPKGKQYAGSWLDNGQINGLVYAQQGDSLTAGIHYKMSQGQSYVGRKVATRQNLTTDFHLYSVEWTNHSVRWFFDDSLVFENAVSKPFDQPFFFVLQLGVGGPEFDTRNMAVQSSDALHWRNNRFVVDYVQIFQDEQLLPKSLLQAKEGSGASCGAALHCSLVSLCLLIWFHWT